MLDTYLSSVVPSADMMMIASLFALCKQEK